MPGKKLVVRLPADHPLWKYPPGQRSQKVREAIDFGLKAIDAFNEIKTLIASLSTRLDRIENLIMNGICVKSGPEDLEEEVPASIESFDVEAFIDI